MEGGGLHGAGPPHTPRRMQGRYKMLCPPQAPDARGSGLQQALALLRLSISVKSRLIGQWGGIVGSDRCPVLLHFRTRGFLPAGTTPQHALALASIMLRVAGPRQAGGTFSFPEAGGSAGEPFACWYSSQQVRCQSRNSGACVVLNGRPQIVEPQP